MDLSKSSVRAKLKPRREPHWQRVSRGAYVGVRKGARGESWVARYRDSSGRQHYRALTQASDFDSAARSAHEWFRACGLGLTQTVSVREAAEQYIAAMRTAKGDGPAQAQLGYLRRTVFEHPIGAIALDRLRAYDIQIWRDAIAEATSKTNANRSLVALRASLNKAYQSQLVASDQSWRSVRPFLGVGRARSDYLTREERRRLIKCARAISPALADFLEVAARIGARPIEIARLRVSDADLRHRTVTLHGYKGKTGALRTRAAPITSSALPLFKRLAAGKAPEAALLTQDNGSEWPHSARDELVRKACDAAGLPASISAYSLRNAFIADLLAGGVDAATVAKVCGTSITLLENTSQNT